MDRSTRIMTRAALVMTMTLAIATAAMASDWSMFHGDSRRSGYSSKDAPFDSLLAWNHAGGDSVVYSSPVLALDGTIYIGTVGERLLALSPAGDVEWSFESAGNFRHSTPAVADDGTIYVGGGDGRLYAVHPDGSLRWTFTAPAPIKTSPNITVNDFILFGADDGLLYAVRPDSTLAWTYPTGGPIRSSPAIGPDGTIFFGSTDSFLYALWPDGTLRWRALTGDQIKFCSPAVSDSGVVYFGSYDGLVYALTSDQQFLWAYPTNHVVRSSPAIGPLGRIFIGSDNQLLALTPDGDLDWNFTTGGEIYSSPVYFGDDDVIGIGSDDGVFYCIAEDGSLDWQFTVGTGIRSTVAPSAGGHIYAADMSGTIWAFGADEPNAVVDPGPAAPGIGPYLLATPNPSSGAVVFRAIGRGAGAGPQALGGSIIIYDVAGREVARLAVRGGGDLFSWDGRDQRGRSVGSGTYFYRLDRSDASGRVVLIR